MHNLLNLITPLAVAAAAVGGCKKPCTPQDVATCAARCADGEGASCRTLAAMYEKGDVAPKDADLARQNWEKACSAGDATACVETKRLEEEDRQKAALSEQKAQLVGLVSEVGPILDMGSVLGSCIDEAMEGTAVCDGLASSQEALSGLQQRLRQLHPAPQLQAPYDELNQMLVEVASAHADAATELIAIAHHRTKEARALSDSSLAHIKVAPEHSKKLSDLREGIATGAASSASNTVHEQDASLPPDGQILRDAAGELAKWRAMEVRIRKKTVSKELDQYERDKCAATVAGQVGDGHELRVFLVYQRQNDFWRLVDVTSRIY